MGKSFDLNKEKCFDIFKDFTFVLAHHGASILKSDTIKVNYKNSTNGGVSPGFRTLLKTKTGNKYHLSINAELLTGNAGFVYVESVKPAKRLIERSIATLKPNCKKRFNLSFVACGELVYVGILFNASKCDSSLIVSEFKVSNNKIESSQCDDSDPTECAVVCKKRGPPGLSGPREIGRAHV